MKIAAYLFIVLLMLAGRGAVLAQDTASDADADAATPEAAAADAPAAAGEPRRAFDQSATELQRRLEQANEELDALRRRIRDEQLPLTRKLRQKEDERLAVGKELDAIKAKLDDGAQELNNLRTQIEQHRADTTYLSTRLTEYIQNFEPRIHIAELRRYEQILGRARQAPELGGLSQREVFQAQCDVVVTSLDRLEQALGGTRFEGSAVDPVGNVKEGEFVLVGPVAVFASDDGQVVGAVDTKLNSAEANVIEFADEDLTEAARRLVRTGRGWLPLDPTMGEAHAIEKTRDTLVEHIRKGGPVMVPIFALAAAALLVGAIKWSGLAFIRTPSRRRLDALLGAVARSDKAQARQHAGGVSGPVGRMLATGVEHLEEPRELVEEIMYEHVMAVRLKLNRMLPFIAICAASAPLLGLLGTVGGIINTFAMMEAQGGTGDIKALSGGISEALITTKFGLIVAIPSLLLHAFLARKARGVVDQMEKSGVALVNQMGKTPYRKMGEAA
jgi:biopolymer transport protein ExbB